MNEEINEKLGLLHQKLEDDQFRETFIASPLEVLEKEGFPLTDEHRASNVVVYEIGQEKPQMDNAENVVYFPIPPQGGVELSDDDLEQASGGFGLGDIGVDLAISAVSLWARR